jgi:hypothetical protein
MKSDARSDENACLVGGWSRRCCSPWARCARRRLAQVPARFYWKTLSGANAVPVIVNSISGNTNPFDHGPHRVTPGANFDARWRCGLRADLHPVGSLRDGGDHAPMGRVSGDVTVAGKTANQSASGFGDPMLEFNINLLGPKAQKNIPDALRYEPGSRSTCSPTSRCRSASTTATSR